MQGGSLNKYQYYLSAGYHDPTYGRLTQAINRYPNFPAVSRAPVSYAYAGNNPATLTQPPGAGQEGGGWRSLRDLLDYSKLNGGKEPEGPVLHVDWGMVLGGLSMMGGGFSVALTGGVIFLYGAAETGHVVHVGLPALYAGWHAMSVGGVMFSAGVAIMGGGVAMIGGGFSFR